MKKTNQIESVLWSIALPGCSQIINGKFLKGLLFISLELLINIQSNFNEVIMLSFHGHIQSAIDRTNYQWLMFYPCLYMFAMWDAYKDAGGGKESFSFLPFVFSAYFITVGLIFSPTLRIMGILFGPVWLPMLFLIIGLFISTFFKTIFQKTIRFNKI
jgi:hypothetical protein